MANTAMSDSGAIPGPTVVTTPVLPCRARESRNGVRAASNGVRSPSSGTGSSARPSRHTYSSLRISSPVLHDQRELLRIQTRAADERPVDLRVRHEVADVAGLHAPPVLDAHAPCHIDAVDLAHRLPDQRDHLSGVRRLGVAARADRPDRLVRDHDVGGVLRPDAAQGHAHLRGHAILGRPHVALLQGLADAQDRRHAVGEHRSHFLVHGLVRVAEHRAALGMPNHDVGDLERLEHRGRDLAGERPLVLPVDVLGAEAVGEAVAVDQRLHAPQGGEGRAHHDLDAVRVALVEQVGELLDRLDRRQMRLVHLPVGRDDRPPVRHAFTSSGTMPGSRWPSRNSTEAPPPVDRWPNPPSSPNRPTPARRSPPPTTVYAFVPAIAVATPRVPAPNGSSSYTPIGPAHMIVFASAIVRANSSTDLGPMSRPIRSPGISQLGTVRRGASMLTSGAATTSSGNCNTTPRSCALAVARCTSGNRSGSTRLLPVEPPASAMNVKAIAPPTRSASTRSTSASIVSHLSETFAPPSTATYGRGGS